MTQFFSLRLRSVAVCGVLAILLAAIAASQATAAKPPAGPPTGASQGNDSTQGNSGDPQGGQGDSGDPHGGQGNSGDPHGGQGDRGDPHGGQGNSGDPQGVEGSGHGHHGSGAPADKPHGRKGRPATIGATDCTAPVFTQPFLDINDSNWYTLAPGQTVDNFDGTGWSLAGGAQVESATVASGATGSVLDLPSGSTAVSPQMCVDTTFKTARTMIRDVAGQGGGVRVAVTYKDGKHSQKPSAAGNIGGNGSDWVASRRFNVKPSHVIGWQLVRFTFAAQGTGTEFQLSNFYVDPRMK